MCVHFLFSALLLLIHALQAALTEPHRPIFEIKEWITSFSDKQTHSPLDSHVSVVCSRVLTCLNRITGFDSTES